MNGAVHGTVRLWIRLEGAATLVAAVSSYAHGGYSWVLFAALFFVPDLSFAGYLAGPRIGATIYNAAHSYVGPLALGLAAAASGGTLVWPLIWIAHIGFDRMPSPFHDLAFVAPRDFHHAVGCPGPRARAAPTAAVRPARLDAIVTTT